MMSSVKQTDPRANQKARTREAIIKAAQGLRADGIEPTIEQAAERARVSRATAYRYFPTKEALQVELADIVPSVRPVDAALESLSGDDLERRLLRLVDTFNPIALADQEHYRTAVRVYQDIWLRSRRNGDEAPLVREGRRMRWLNQALAPLDGHAPQHGRLKAALALTLGIESIIVMKDVCRLDDDESLDVLRWAATALLRAGLEETGRRPQERAPEEKSPVG